MSQLSFRCDFCAEVQPTEKLKQCNVCKLVAYCSKDCQAKHWKESHKNECEAFHHARKARGESSCSLSRKIRVKRAQRYQELGKYKSAEKEWREIIDSEVEPRSMDHYNLGMVLQSQEKLQDAVHCFREAALEINNSQEREEYRTSALAQMGLTLGSLGKHKEAIEAIETAMGIGLDPDLVSVSAITIGLGDNLRCFHKFQEAVRAYQLSLEVSASEIEWSPHDSQNILKRRVHTHDRIGFCLLNLKKWDEAAFYLQKALEGYSEIIDEARTLNTYQNLGNALVSNGKMFEGAKVLRQAHSLYPDDASIMYYLGCCVWFEANSLVTTEVVPIKTFQDYLRKLLEAQKLCNKAMELKPALLLLAVEKFNYENINDEVAETRAQYETMVRNNIESCYF